MNTQKSDFKGLAVVRNSMGLIRCGNYENLSEEYQDLLRILVMEDGGVTAESYPDLDKRFIGGNNGRNS
jgi:hypothetical protein